MGRWLEWLPGRSLVGALRQDRLLALFTLVLSLAALAPLAVTSFLPFVDLPGNVANASLLLPTLLGKGITGQHYEILWRPIPYWTAYLFLTLTSGVVGPLLAAKLLVGLLVLALPLCTMRLLLALGRSPRVGLWAFALVWDRNLYWGWVTFLLGMALAMVALARLLEARTLRESMRAAPFAVLVALTHIEGVAFLLLAGALAGLLGRPRGPSLLRAVVGVGGRWWWWCRGSGGRSRGYTPGFRSSSGIRRSARRSRSFFSLH